MPDHPHQHIAGEIDRINAEVTGIITAAKLPEETAAALAAQSMAQSLAIATSDAVALLRNVETMMSAVQAAALTRWVERGGGEDDPGYQRIAAAAGRVTSEAVGLWRDINLSAQQLLHGLTSEGKDSAVESAVASPSASASPKQGKKKASKKKASKKKSSKKSPGKKAAKKKPAKPPATPSPARDV